MKIPRTEHDNSHNKSNIPLVLRRINENIYDRIFKRDDKYYYRKECGIKAYDDKHSYGLNVLHDYKYMIYPLPANEIQEVELLNFTPPKLLDGDSMFTVTSEGLLPSEVTIKVPIDRRYLASRELVRGKVVNLKARIDRNNNKKIWIKEIHNDTNKVLAQDNVLNIRTSTSENEKITQMTIPCSLNPNETLFWEDYYEKYGIKTNVQNIKYNEIKTNSYSHKTRFVRETMSGSSANSGNHWVEIKIFDKKGNNIARNPGVRLSSSGTSTNLHYLTDNDTNANNWYDPGNGNGSWVEIDLGKEYIIDKIQIWHHYSDPRKYNCKLEIFPTNRDNPFVVFDSAIDGAYAETAAGKEHFLNKNETKYAVKSIDTFSLTEESFIEDLKPNTKYIILSKYVEKIYNIYFYNNQSLIGGQDLNYTNKIINDQNNESFYYYGFTTPSNCNRIKVTTTKNNVSEDSYKIIEDVVTAQENDTQYNVENFRINDQKKIIYDPNATMYVLSENTANVISILAKNSSDLIIGASYTYPSDGAISLFKIDYTSTIVDNMSLLKIDLTKYMKQDSTGDIIYLFIVTKDINSTAKDGLELYHINANVTVKDGYHYDDIKWLDTNTEIIEVDYIDHLNDVNIYNYQTNKYGYTIDETTLTETQGNASDFISDFIEVYNNKNYCLQFFEILNTDLRNDGIVFYNSSKELIADSYRKLNANNNLINFRTITQNPSEVKYVKIFSNNAGINAEKIKFVEETSEMTYTDYMANKIVVDNNIEVIGGPSVLVSAPYYSIRELPAPTNIKAVDLKTSLLITWDEILGADAYVVYLEDEVLEVVYTNELELFRELRGYISIKAINSITQSAISERVFIHSVPRNPFIIYIDNVYEDYKYKFVTTFLDNSELEESYNVKYIIDDREEESVNILGGEGTGTMMKANFSSTAVDQRVRVRVTAINEAGENEVAPYLEMRQAPPLRWAYKRDTQQLTLAWNNTFHETELYLVRYRKETDELYKTQTIINEYTPDSLITTYIDLKESESMYVSLAPTVREDLPHIFTKPILCSAATDVNLVPPQNFSLRKLENDTVEFSWVDNYVVERGWEISYTLNNGTPQTIRIDSSTAELTGRKYTYVWTFPDHGFLNAKLRMIWELGASDYTETLTTHYFPVENDPPSNIRREYKSMDSMNISWDAQGYVENYQVSVVFENQKEEIFTINDNNYLLKFKSGYYSIKVRTNFLGDITSAWTPVYRFCPTMQNNKMLVNMTNQNVDKYDFIEKIYSASDWPYDIVTRSITEDLEEKYPIQMVSTTLFTISRGLIETETWDTSQRYVYTDLMDISTKMAEFVRQPLVISSYQETVEQIKLQTDIITKILNNYKIEMEINKTRIVCLGDSITAGHPGYWAESGTGDIEYQYPYWLDRRLKFKYEVINKGYGSDRTTDLLKRIDKDVIALAPQYCIIQIGTNDIYWGAAGSNGDMEKFEEVLNGMKNNMRILVQKCLDNNIRPIIGNLIPRTQSVTDELVKYGLYGFNEWIAEYANTTEGLNYIDFFNAGKDAIPPTPIEDPDSPGAMNPIYDGDNIYDEMGNLVQYGAGIHLNKEGYRIMAEAIPLNLFQDFSTGVKMYMDKECTIEAEYNTEDKQNPFYKITVEAMQLTRTKKIIRYIKNVGITQTLYALYPTKVHNLKYTFKSVEMENAEEMAYGILTPGMSTGIVIELTPQVEDSKAELELSLVGREFAINS